MRWAWAGFWLVIAGTAVAAVTMALGKASVLYTFYPPMVAQPVLLPGRGAGGGGLVDLGRADGHQPARVEEGEPGRDRAARDVRQRGRRVPVGVDLGGRGDRECWC